MGLVCIAKVESELGEGYGVAPLQPERRLLKAVPADDDLGRSTYVNLEEPLERPLAVADGFGELSNPRQLDARPDERAGGDGIARVRMVAPYPAKPGREAVEGIGVAVGAEAQRRGRWALGEPYADRAI